MTKWIKVCWKRLQYDKACYISYTYCKICRNAYQWIIICASGIASTATMSDGNVCFATVNVLSLYKWILLSLKTALKSKALVPTWNSDFKSVSKIINRGSCLSVHLQGTNYKSRLARSLHCRTDKDTPPSLIFRDKV